MCDIVVSEGGAVCGARVLFLRGVADDGADVEECGFAGCGFGFIKC